MGYISAIEEVSRLYDKNIYFYTSKLNSKKNENELKFIHI